MKAEEHIEVIQHTTCGIRVGFFWKCNIKEDHSATQQLIKSLCLQILIFLGFKMHIFFCAVITSVPASELQELMHLLQQC